ncbi:MAG: hypothetical protein ACF8MJ_03590 [Phycisphaerales bacterium JB050]
MPQIADIKPTPFSEDAQQVVRSLRAALSDGLVAAGANPNAPQSICEHIGLNKNLAWKLSRIIQTDDSAAALELMPGSSGIQILLRNMNKAGIDQALRERIREAVGEYERLIRVHSGDRQTLEMLGSELTTTGRQERDEQHRKVLYQGTSYVWGAQAQVLSKVGVVLPGETAGTLDFATVNGFVGFRRLRHDVYWEMARRDASNDDGTEMDTTASEPIDPRIDQTDGAPLMLDFCSKPLPALKGVRVGSKISYQLKEGLVGNTGAFSCFVGAIHRGIPYVRTPINEWGNHNARCEVPTELMIVDLFIHHSLVFALAPEVLLLSGVDSPLQTFETRRLPLHEKLQNLGRSRVPAPTPEVPRYRALVEAVLDRFDRSLEEFHGLRMKIAYPVYPSMLQLRYRLPDQPIR